MGFFQKKCVGLYGVCQKQTMKCQKFSFWQNCGVFGSVFGICLMIEVAEMPRNKEIQGLYGECQKFNFWQNRGMFLAYWKRFLADYSCKISRKPINRAFHGYLWNAKNIAFWHFREDFWQTTDVRIVGKPINRAFEGVSVECQKFRIWQEKECFWQGFWQRDKDFWHCCL